VGTAIFPTSPPVAKNKMTFILLGVFLGALGGHNGSPMAWLWAVIEICIVNHDSKGVQFQS
jgi:hypothetical protein